MVGFHRASLNKNPVSSKRSLMTREAISRRDLGCSFFRRGPSEFVTSQLAPVVPPVLAGKSFLLCFRAENLAPLSIIQDELIAALKNLKGLRYLIHLIELHRARLAEIFEVRWIHEVAHRNAVHGKA